eukprot:TRINITY_DN9474_c0_g1_i4.p1 TRINITY_DN9474_c0_g1~~TRINITY_DN9474_c0_g1_i4.p1  ORF type:complete len:126 (-),score=13.98 TRINITY_DN9474_c0_g1_i4:130-507(-)
MSTSDIISEANSLFVDECYEDALEKFTRAIELDETKSDYYSKRSNCKLKLEDFTGAMQDAIRACQLDPACPIAHFRKGMAAFSQEEFESALAAFSKAQELKPSSHHKLWIRKSQAEIEESKFNWD